MDSGGRDSSVHNFNVCSLAKTLMANERWYEVGGIHFKIGTLGQYMMKSRAELGSLALRIEAL